MTTVTSSQYLLLHPLQQPVEHGRLLLSPSAHELPDFSFDPFSSDSAILSTRSLISSNSVELSPALREEVRKRDAHRLLFGFGCDSDEIVPIIPLTASLPTGREGEMRNKGFEALEEVALKQGEADYTVAQEKICTYLYEAGIVPQGFDLQHPSNLLCMNPLHHSMWVEEGVFTIVLSTKYARRLKQFVGAENKAGQYFADSGRARMRKLHNLLPLFGLPEYELIFFHPERFSPRGTVFPVKFPDGSVLEYGLTEDGSMREDGINGLPCLPPFSPLTGQTKWNERDINPFLVVLNTAWKGFTAEDISHLSVDARRVYDLNMTLYRALLKVPEMGEKAAPLPVSKESMGCTSGVGSWSGTLDDSAEVKDLLNSEEGGAEGQLEEGSSLSGGAMSELTSIRKLLDDPMVSHEHKGILDRRISHLRGLNKRDHSNCSTSGEDTLDAQLEGEDAGASEPGNGTGDGDLASARSIEEGWMEVKKGWQRELGDRNRVVTALRKYIRGLEESNSSLEKRSAALMEELKRLRLLCA